MYLARPVTRFLKDGSGSFPCHYMETVSSRVSVGETRTFWHSQEEADATKRLIYLIVNPDDLPIVLGFHKLAWSK